MTDVSDERLRDLEHLYDIGSTNPGTVRSMASELLALRAEREWRPIETAPKDGTPILLTWRAVIVAGQPAQDFQSVGYWHPEFELVSWENDSPDYQGAWTDGVVASWSYEEIRELHPTHWRPLPAPPLATPTNGEKE